jgi:hypothetical protein
VTGLELTPTNGVFNSFGGGGGGGGGGNSGGGGGIACVSFLANNFKQFHTVLQEQATITHA